MDACPVLEPLCIYLYNSVFNRNMSSPCPSTPETQCEDVEHQLSSCETFPRMHKIRVASKKLGAIFLLSPPSSSLWYAYYCFIPDFP